MCATSSAMWSASRSYSSLATPTWSLDCRIKAACGDSGSRAVWFPRRGSMHRGQTPPHAHASGLFVRVSESWIAGRRGGGIEARRVGLFPVSLIACSTTASEAAFQREFALSGAPQLGEVGADKPVHCGLERGMAGGDQERHGFLRQSVDAAVWLENRCEHPDRKKPRRNGGAAEWSAPGAARSSISSLCGL